jgi:hypothetical protein
METQLGSVGYRFRFALGPFFLPALPLRPSAEAESRAGGPVVVASAPASPLARVSNFRSPMPQMLEAMK